MDNDFHKDEIKFIKLQQVCTQHVLRNFVIIANGLFTIAMVV